MPSPGGDSVVAGLQAAGCGSSSRTRRLRRLWDDAAPFLDPVVAPIAGTRQIEPHPDARRELGLPPGKLALLFGEPQLKRLDVVLDAFAALDEWTLVVGGPVADEVPHRPGLVTFPGTVDDVVRDQLFAAVDLVVLSYMPRYPNESGTLMDAISTDTPVVCSDDAAAAAIVLRHHVGTIFSAEDAGALARAVRQAAATVDPGVFRGAREELSDLTIARRQLCLLGVAQSS